MISTKTVYLNLNKFSENWWKAWNRGTLNRAAGEKKKNTQINLAFFSLSLLLKRFDALWA